MNLIQKPHCCFRRFMKGGRKKPSQQLTFLPLSSASHIIVPRKSMDDNNLSKFVSSDDLMVILVSATGETVRITSNVVMQDIPDAITEHVNSAIRQIVQSNLNTQVFVMHDHVVYLVDGFALGRATESGSVINGGGGGVVFLRRCKNLPPAAVAAAT